MSYGVARIASYTLEALILILRRDGTDAGCADWGHKGIEYIWEDGIEHSDGRITGKVHRMLKDGKIDRGRGGCISPFGVVKRFPTSTVKQRCEAERIGGQEYVRYCERELKRG